MLTMQFDGLFRGAPQECNLGDNAGFMCYGWVILRDDTVIARGHGGYARSREASSNVAEYLGLIEGLEALLDMFAGSVDEVEICGDAKSVIEQMQGIASVSAASIKPLNRRARKLTAHFRQINWSWTPRRNNHTADALTRRALRQIRANPEEWEAALEAFNLRKRSGHESSKLHSILDLRLYQAEAAI
ncbi:MAG: ribonuclease HI family protein [Anaerolineaceae bacterium]|nr:ribonuclease HI family protein [Anaerolineaceae bacterium]